MDKETIERIKALINLEIPDGAWLLIWTPDHDAMAHDRPVQYLYMGDRISMMAAHRMASGVAKQIEEGNARVL